MSNYAKLKAELTGDPLAIGYATMTDVECAESLHAKTRTRTKPISSAALLAWAGGGANDNTELASRYERIETAAANHYSKTVKGACKAAIRLVQRDGTYLDLSDQQHAGMVDALVAGNVLSSAEQDELTLLSDELISRATELGLGRVLPGHITKARA